MKKFNLEKCKSSNKGITLIALVITIIVLLILAGITINALTGSESAPAKANEAKQKNDIGAVKDEIALTVQNAQMDAYDDIYVKNNSAVSSTAATTTVGQRVINAVLEHFGGTARGTSNANDTLTATTTKGLVTITVSQAKGANAAITLETRDITETGSISYDGGVLTWDGTSQAGGNTVAELVQSGTIKRWDTINYSATGTISSADLPDGAKIEGTKVADMTALDGKTIIKGATLDGTIDASEAKDWVVLDITEDGDVLIMPRTVSETTLTLTGKDGYNNAIQALNEVAGIYLNSTYATSARSITQEDVNKVENISLAEEEVSEQTWNHRYGVNLDKQNINYKFLDIIDEGEGNTANQTYKAINNDSVSVFSFGGMLRFWLASRALDNPSDECAFHVCNVEHGSTNGGNLFKVYSNGSATVNEYSCVVIPVVTLKSNIKLKPALEFYAETATATEACDEETEFVHISWAIE